MKPITVVFVWRMVEVVDPSTGEAVRRAAMVPLPRFDNVARRQFGDPKDNPEHPLVPEHSRNMKSHNAYFAEIHRAFESRPEGLNAMWPNEEILRLWCLIETGWCNQEDFEAPDETHARRLAKFIRKETGYAQILLIENPTTDLKTKVIVRTPRSQSVSAMNAADFEASKKDVLDCIVQMFGMNAADLRREVRSSMR